MIYSIKYNHCDDCDTCKEPEAEVAVEEPVEEFLNHKPLHYFTQVIVIVFVSLSMTDV